MARRQQVLYRDTDDGTIGGVCSGLGRYFDVDTTLVRVAFVIAAMLGGGGILGYVILWIVLDPAPAGYWDEPGLDAADESASSGEAPRDGAEVVDLTNPQTTDAAQS